jgi:glutamate synthase (NADPH/NADH) small chain
MGKITGFLEFDRQSLVRRPVVERILDYREVDQLLSGEKLTEQAARCMDCGIPFCQSGCPLDNVIPDWNDLVYKGRWKEAFDRLTLTNNFPEFTGRLCPAPCESSCVLGINSDPVTIEQIEHAIVERAFAEGWVVPTPPKVRRGTHVAVVGSGPAGLACADQLNKAGHHVTVFERHDRAGGLLRYGIPDFKLEKRILDRRLGLMEQGGIRFVTNTEVGVDISAAELTEFDAIVLAGGATVPRDLSIDGRDLDGIHFAWNYLQQQNRRVAGDELNEHVSAEIVATDKHVIVIGGGDTGSDCVGTANRQKAASVTQFELLPTPPDTRPDNQPWPTTPVLLRSTSSHEEGCERQWSILTTNFRGEEGKVTHLDTVNAQSLEGGGFEPISDTERSWQADLILLAIGYVGPERTGILSQLGAELGGAGTVATGTDYSTNLPGVFSAGDMRRGQSLIVWAIREGRDAAENVDQYLLERS